MMQIPIGYKLRKPRLVSVSNLENMIRSLKNIRIILIDDNGNIGGREIGFEVYAPDPEIDAINGNIITGQIDETLLDEPMRLYRYRGGVIEKLQKS